MLIINKTLILTNTSTCQKPNGMEIRKMVVDYGARCYS